jgi:hypothetical protein
VDSCLPSQHKDLRLTPTKEGREGAREGEEWKEGEGMKEAGEEGAHQLPASLPDQNRNNPHSRQQQV